MKLDTNLQTSEERLKYIEDYLVANPTPNETELDWIANYLTYPLDKEERLKDRLIMTSSRNKTISDHETSYDGLAAKFEAGEDAVEAISQSRAPIKVNITPKKRAITQKDLDTVPGLKTVRESIAFWEQVKNSSTGKKAYIAQKAYREDSKLQYILRDSFYPPIGAAVSPNFTAQEPEYYSKEYVDEKGNVHGEGFTLLNADLDAELLRYYIKLKGKNWGKFNDLWFLIADFENALFEALKDNAIFQLIVEAKWSNLSNQEIVKEIENEFGVTYTPEVISNIYCQKIPKMIAETYYDTFLDWWYLEKEKGSYKVCSCCGQTLLAHPRFFNRNSTSRDGFYSQCKKCRAQKRKKGSK